MLHDGLEQLEKDGTPIKVGVIGAGTFGTQIISQVCRIPGMRMSAVADLQVDRAMRALKLGGRKDDAVLTAETSGAIDDAIGRDLAAVTTRADALIGSGIDVVVEATGNPDLGARHGHMAIEGSKHLVMVTVEAEVLVGYLLRTMADEAGVIYSAAYGDEPSLAYELVDWARTLGFKVIAAGKGSRYKPDFRHATPDDVAELYGFKGEDYNARMFCSFLDNTKSQIEMAALSNMTGLRPDVRGLRFPPLELGEIPEKLCLESEGGILEHEGVVEAVSSLHPDGREVAQSIRGGMYAVVGSDTPFAIDSLASYDQILGMVIGERSRKAMIYRRQHFVGHEVPIGIARMMLLGKASGAPKGHFSDVVVGAKKDLEPGTVLDGEGGFTVYGMIETTDVARSQNLLPMGLAHGAELVRPVGRDEALTYDDVRLGDSFALTLRRRQDGMT
ncbi:MAG: flagellar biosynthesis protein FlgA [Phycisphaeraceae bacterium]|nr:flagellar biosynthesis protein FlgA [Phycisphaeraceae bacterium]